MILSPADITPDFVDISSTWRRRTGESITEATAHLLGGSVHVVRVVRRGEHPEIMNRGGAAAQLSDTTMQRIEAGARARRKLQ